MRSWFVIGLAFVLAGVTGIVVFTSLPTVNTVNAPNYNSVPRYGPGMMGRGYYGGGGMMGGWRNSNPSVPKIGMDGALEIAQSYLRAINNPDLAIDEIMEFQQNFYVIYYEKSTGVGAFEMLIDKSTGNIYPEYGPNMMWNTKYGHMGVMGGMMGGFRSYPSGQMPISLNESIRLAQTYLDRAFPGTLAEESHQFYGYYTVHSTRDGKVSGMLSVNGYSGAVWYHSWHGSYIQSREIS